MLRILALAVTALAAPRLAPAELPPVGTVVDKDNAEKYGEVLNPTQQYMLKHGATMPVTEYRKYEWQRVYKEATEKYSSQVKLQPDGRDIVGTTWPAPRSRTSTRTTRRPARNGCGITSRGRIHRQRRLGWNMELVNNQRRARAFLRLELLAAHDVARPASYLIPSRRAARPRHRIHRAVGTAA